MRTPSSSVESSSDPDTLDYLLAHSQRAVVPRDPGGPHGKRIKVTLGGNLSWTLRVQAYATGRISSTDWQRYTIVVLNWYDFPNGQWNPTPVNATIEFRGVQAQYTFPVGMTTLWLVVHVLQSPTLITEGTTGGTRLLGIRIESTRGSTPLNLQVTPNIPTGPILSRHSDVQGCLHNIISPRSFH